MTEIKNIIFVKSEYNFIQNFVYFINHLLPLKVKFKNESFVATENNKIQGLITLDKDSKSYTRFKITKLILEEGATTYAHQLVSYVISRYRAMGASSFYIVADEKQSDLLNIFQNELNFRACGCEYLYKVNIKDKLNPLLLKEFKKNNTKEVCEFYNGNINSYNRFLFSRQPYQFSNNFEKYVFFNEKNGSLIGYFEIFTNNSTDFYINFSIDFAYNIYIIDAVSFIASKLKHKNKKFNLYIKIKDYFMNSKELIEILNENNFKLISKSRILAKDYYKEIKEKNLFESTKIIFNDPTTA